MKGSSSLIGDEHDIEGRREEAAQHPWRCREKVSLGRAAFPIPWNAPKAAWQCRRWEGIMLRCSEQRWAVAVESTDLLADQWVLFPRGVGGGSPTRFFELTGGGGRLLPRADSEPLGLSPQTSRFRLWSWETSEYRTEFHLFLQLKDPYLKENKDKGLWQLIGVDRNFRLFRCDGCPFARGLGRANSQFLKLEKKQGQNVGLLEVWQQSWVKSIPLST